MEIQILNRNVELTADLRMFTERRLRFALSRFSSKIVSVDVTISDINGPKGGLDKQCRLGVRFRNGHHLMITHCDATVESSVARGAERVGRSVGRYLDRHRTQRWSRATIKTAHDPSDTYSDQ